MTYFKLFALLKDHLSLKSPHMFKISTFIAQFTVETFLCLTVPCPRTRYLKPATNPACTQVHRALPRPENHV
ncbi:hypothetical protein BABINDRAFT_159142 [Babjeviella inositovora NRRL Y-12698]|uniref:Uncharacterized protein n=1 Tax=Babjeviella inositovora NRRL Y-12698 TaxID=984486 RepID=A0A1E3QY51_9ASCO|nr:uncharacterized protein BABINDRAFT_159142 [Babjeviella inositovora NRRL Y-12698]ODQ82583.1 hypothetical protein BABINDRAFT_159142 [Babjeviella inositovora NRRL Y-12698]